MRGMNAETGEVLDSTDHLRQSIQDILRTPVGSRVMRRQYGSRLMDLLDRPLNEAFIADLQAAIAMALGAQEPRLRLTRVSVERPDPAEAARELSQGRISLRLEGYYIPESRNVTLDIPLS